MRCTGTVTGANPRNSWRCTRNAVRGTQHCRACAPRPVHEFIVVFPVHLASGETQEIEVPMRSKSAGEAIDAARSAVKFPAGYRYVDRPTIR